MARCEVRSEMRMPPTCTLSRTLQSGGPVCMGLRPEWAMLGPCSPVSNLRWPASSPQRLRKSLRRCLQQTSDRLAGVSCCCVHGGGGLAVPPHVLPVADAVDLIHGQRVPAALGWDLHARDDLAVEARARQHVQVRLQRVPRVKRMPCVTFRLPADVAPDTCGAETGATVHNTTWDSTAIMMTWWCMQAQASTEALQIIMRGASPVCP